MEIQSALERRKAAARARRQLTEPPTDAGEWLCRLMPAHFRNSDPHQQFAPHHRDFLDWGWNWDATKEPACLWIVNRGGNKSTTTAGLAVGLGARGCRRYGLVITRTETQGDTHVRRVASMLTQSRVGEFYASMAKPDVKEVGNRKMTSAWNRTMLSTDAGWTLQSFSLQASLRGVGLEEFRPDFIWITDIDNENDSVGMVQTLLNALSASVLATMGPDCMVVFDQNLIHRGSILNQILTRKTDVLSHRKVVGPVPALYDVDDNAYVRRDERWHIVKGRPSWPGGMPLEECQAKINLWGMDTWRREAQHDVDMPYRDAIYKRWSELYHVITWSEFVAGFVARGIPRETFYTRNPDGSESIRLPERGRIVQAQDWGNNANHPCATRWCWTPPEEFKFKWPFFYREMCWPRYPSVENDSRGAPSAGQVGEAIIEAERPWKESSRVQWRIASHERPEIVQAYRVDLPKQGLPALNFAQINTANARAGIIHMQDFLALEPDKPHPFRRYPTGHPKAGEPLPGSPRVFFIVADGQGELYYENGSLRVRPALDEAGMARTRFEYPNYRKPDTAQGAEAKDPPKIDDDVIDCDRAIAGLLFPAIQQMTDQQRESELFPEEVKAKVAAIGTGTLTKQQEQVALMGLQQAKGWAAESLRRQQARSRKPTSVYDVRQKYR